MSQFLIVSVEPGPFSTERVVTFQVGDTRYQLVVDQEDVRDGRLRVMVLGKNSGKALIDLPRDTFSGGSRMYVPVESLHAG